jgi:acylphosphatase
MGPATNDGETNRNGERCVRAVVSGRVQGVFYRASTAERAVELGLRGYVRNLPDGRVEVVAEGNPTAVEALLTFCRTGPPAARVERVDVDERPPGSSGEKAAFRVRN